MPRDVFDSIGHSKIISSLYPELAIVCLYYNRTEQNESSVILNEIFSLSLSTQLQHEVVLYTEFCLVNYFAHKVRHQCKQ